MINTHDAPEQLGKPPEFLQRDQRPSAILRATVDQGYYGPAANWYDVGHTYEMSHIRYCERGYLCFAVGELYGAGKDQLAADGTTYDVYDSEAIDDVLEVLMDSIGGCITLRGHLIGKLRTGMVRAETYYEFWAGVIHRLELEGM